MKVINTEKKPIKMWLEEIEESALEQARNLANLPFTYKHVAIMPDCHTGYGMPIGGVLATEGVVVPNAVGVDIGCGMCAMRTSLTGINTEELKAILGGTAENTGGIRARIPVGMRHQNEAQEWEGFEDAPDVPIVQEHVDSARKQLGTLGGGNHFIEIQRGSDGFIWIMIHSGSRNFGYQIAKHYNKLAQVLCKQWHSSIPEPKGEDGLAFLPIDTEEGQEYLSSMEFALQFARMNRHHMMHVIKEEFQKVLNCKFHDLLNVHHNYARMENHFGKNVVVHRKGATSARSGEYGIIPGSQGTRSYIVIGKGNPESFNSCSHGAGRKMSRTRAQNELDLQEEQKKLDSKGILHSIRNKKDLDEATGAYKSIDQVMQNQNDLVQVYVELSPLAVVKG